MPKRKSKRGSVALGFILTVGILGLLSVFLLASNPGVTVAQIPDRLPTYAGVLQSYAPSDALQVSFDNLTAIRSVNQTVISNQQFFAIDRPFFSVNSSAIGWRMTVAFSTPNATVTVAALNQASFDSLSSIVKGAGEAAIPTDSIANITLYAAAGTISHETQAYWFALMPRQSALLFSPGANDALQALKHVVGVQLGTVRSILNRTDIGRMIYAINGTQGHLALGIQNFPGSVRTGNATLISVDANQGSAYISYVVRFNSPSIASEQVTTVKQTYISAHEFFIYGELVKAIEIQPASQLKVAVGLVG